MRSSAPLEEYLEEVRKQVCSRCIERPPGGPPCLPLGKRCGIELHLPAYIDAIHAANSSVIDPYLDHIHDDVCSHCPQRGSEVCLCPMEYLIGLLVQAVETVDQRHSQGIRAALPSDG